MLLGKNRRDEGSWDGAVQLEKEADVGHTMRGTVSTPEDQLRGSVQGKPTPQWIPSPWPSAIPRQGCVLGPREQRNL